MLEVIKYLNACITDHPYDTLAELKEEFGIKHSHSEEYPELYVLNYCQIDSPKFNPITGECRSLVVEYVKQGEWKVVSRSFDRFFNYGETDCGYNASELIANEKMDGSLIGVFFHENYGWLYRTRSMIMPTGPVNAMGTTWKELIEEALGTKWFAESSLVTSHPGFTFILEVTSPENRIVTRYEGRNMTLLAARSKDGMYLNPEAADNIANRCGWNVPQRWTFESMADCAQGAQDLRDLNEGYVMYNRLGEPVCKVKNPAYVAAHHLRGEGVLTPKRVVNLLEINEMAEYLSIFPEDAGKMEPYVRAYFKVFAEAETLWTLYSTVTDQKEFALKVAKSPVATLLFRKRQGNDFKESFANMTVKNRTALVEKFV
ncbi:RNA ligase and tail fiber protein attachment cata lyst [Vibrio phage D148]